MNPLTREELRGSLPKILSGYASYTHVPHGLETPTDLNMEQAQDALMSLFDTQKLDPFDFVQACEENCSKERHAYHQGQWDMALRIKAAQEPPKQPTNGDLVKGAE